MRITEHAFSDEPMSDADAAAIEEYLELPTKEQLVQQLAPVRNMQRALSRPHQAKVTLRERRTTLAGQLSNDGLITLLDHLATSHGVRIWLNNDFLNEFEDALPAFQEFKARWARGSEDAEAKHAAQQAAALSQAKEILGDRWRDGPVDAREWMTVITGATDGNKVLRAWSAYVGARDYLRRDGDDEEEIAPVKPVDLEQRNKWVAARQFVDGYSIGLRPPSCIKAILKANFADRWPEGRRFEADSEKVLAVLKWYPFWQQHGPGYLEALEEAARLAKTGGVTNSTKGKSGVREKARKKWLHFTQEFLVWTERKKLTMLLIESYPKQDGVPETKGREFLKTLLTARGNLGSHKAMQETLSGVGIKLIQKHAEECFSVLFERKIPKR